MFASHGSVALAVEEVTTPEEAALVDAASLPGASRSGADGAGGVARSEPPAEAPPEKSGERSGDEPGKKGG